MQKITLAALVALAFSTAASQAAVITVNSTSTNVADDGFCTLIEAIDSANLDTPSGTMSGECIRGAGADILELQLAETYTLTAVNNSDPGPLGDSDGDNGLPSVTSEITITGFDSIIERSDAPDTPPFRIFRIPPAGRLMLRDLTVRNGDRFVGGGTPQINGGGILNQGSLVLDHVVIRENKAINAGGGIDNVGQLTVIDSLFVENWAGEGAAVRVSRSELSFGSAEIVRSTFTGNSTFEGPGTITCAPGTLDIFNSTVSGNVVGDGVGVSNCDLSIVNTTITDNELSGLFVSSSHSPSPTQIKNTIIAGQRLGPDCFFLNFGELVSRGHNLDSDDSCTLDAPTDLPQTNPLLGPLADNGGPTPTHALLEGSPAIDAGDNTECPVTDQRGVVRPRDGNSDGNAVCDIGAYEVALIAPIDELQLQINALVDGGILTEQQGNVLFHHAELALDMAGRGNIEAACNKTKALLNQVQAYIYSRQLTEAEAQGVIDAANRLLGDIGCSG